MHSPFIETSMLLYIIVSSLTSQNKERSSTTSVIFFTDTKKCNALVLSRTLAHEENNRETRQGTNEDGKQGKR